MRNAVRMRVRAFMSSDGSPRKRQIAPAALLLGLAALGGCAGPQAALPSQRLARQDGRYDPHYGVRASPRVYAENEEIPPGGGRYQVGKPYTVAGKTYYPSEKPYAATGTASWYGSDFHGRLTANGEVFDRNSLTAAHPTMPLPSYARVTNLRNSRSIVVRVNDRGPYHGGRVMDVSQRVAEALDFRGDGTTHVKVEWLGRAEIEGSDNSKLLASLRTDGAPATLEGFAETVVAAAKAGAPLRAALAEPTRRDYELEDAGVVEKPSPPDAGAAKRSSDTMTELVKKVGEEAAPPALGSAPLPPTRPLDLGVTSGRSDLRQVAASRG